MGRYTLNMMSQWDKIWQGPCDSSFLSKAYDVHLHDRLEYPVSNYFIKSYSIAYFCNQFLQIWEFLLILTYNLLILFKNY